MLRIFFTVFFLSTCSAWVAPNSGSVRTALHSESSEFNKDGEVNPCWQDIYDEDCTMDSIFSARFVPSEWIKELPCGSGMEDCDFPEHALLPEIRPESQINVMEFLNIKRADDSKLTP